MKCSICKNGLMEGGHTTVTLSRGTSTLIIKEVPAHVCDNCGEYWLDSDIAKIVYSIADEAVKKGAEVEICRFVAA